MAYREVIKLHDDKSEYYEMQRLLYEMKMEEIETFHIPGEEFGLPPILVYALASNLLLPMSDNDATNQWNIRRFKEKLKEYLKS